jgi:uncharacterized membrane protein
VVSVVLFGGLALFAFAGMPIVDRRHRRRLGDAAWQALVAGTTIVPLVGNLPLRPGRRLLLGALAGLAVYAALLSSGHLWLFGADPLAPIRR